MPIWEICCTFAVAKLRKFRNITKYLAKKITKNIIIMENLNRYIKPSHLKMVDKFNEELRQFAEYTDELPPTLYEDAFTYFTLWNVRVIDGMLYYEYDGKTESNRVVFYDDEEQVYYEEDWLDGIPQFIKYWRACIRKAKRYFQEDPEVLDKIYDFEREDITFDDEE